MGRTLLAIWVAAAGLAGCSGSLATLDNRSQTVLFDRDLWLVGQTCPDGCGRVQFVTGDDGEPGWVLEARVKVKAQAGWSYGRAPITVGYLSEAACEQARTQFRQKGTPTGECRPTRIKRLGAMQPGG
jgi:hypothetical protein